MSARRVIVTGATGFIGRHTIPLLLDRGYEVFSIGRGALPPELFALQARSPERFTHSALDLLDSSSVSPWLATVRASHMLHFAWDTRHGLFWSSEENEVWLARSRDLIRSFVEHGGRRFVGAGTCAEYEWGSVPLSEITSPLIPTTPYGGAKLRLSQFLAQPDVSSSLSCAWGRVFHLFGPYEYEKRLVSSVCLALIKGKAFSATAGHQRRDFSSTIDIAHTFVSLLDSDVTGDINLASGEVWTVGDLLRGIARHLGREGLLRLGEIPVAPTDPPVIIADTSRLRDELGFKFPSTVAQRLAETVEWWRAQTRSR